MPVLVGAILLSLATLLAIAGIGVLLRAVRHAAGQPLTTTTTGLALALFIAAAIVTVFGFGSFFDLNAGAGVSTLES